MNSQPPSCHHCGNNIKGEVNKFTGNREVYHENCRSIHVERCKKAAEEFKAISANPHILWMGIDVTYLYGQKIKDKDSKKKRAIKIQELLEKVSALRNSNSGSILIHLIGLAPGDNFTGSFDEFADFKLQGLINDGNSFDDVYKKKRLSAYPGFSDFSDFLVLFVKGADFLTTADFKTKSSLDSCMIDTPDLTVFKFVQNRRKFKENYHTIPLNIPRELHLLQESRHIQTKGFYENSSSAQDIVYSVFDKLKLAEYISAFSKNKDGGSYLLGIGEEAYDNQSYQSKIFVIKAVTIDDCEDVKKLIEERVTQTVLVCDYDGVKKGNTDLIQIFFIPASDCVQQQPRDYIIHVSVRSVSGIVFYSKDGPVAYKVGKDPHSICLLSLKEWIKAFKHRTGLGKGSD